MRVNLGLRKLSVNPAETESLALVDWSWLAALHLQIPSGVGHDCDLLKHPLLLWTAL